MKFEERKIGQRKHLHREFNDYTEFTNYVEQDAPRWALGNSSKSNYEGYGSGATSWHGTRSYAEALTQAREGWPEGSKKIKEMAHAIVSRVTSMVAVPEIAYTVEGSGMIDMGRYLEGEPENFMIWTETEQAREAKGKIIKIVYNCCTSAGVSPDTMFRRGAAIVALADAFERSGVRAQIEVTCFNSGAGYSYGGGVSSEYRVMVKRPDMPVQLDVLAFAIASPSHFRRFIFRAYELEEKGDQQGMGIGGGYGRPADSEDTSTHGDIYFKSAYLGEPQWSSDEATIKWCLDTLRAQGVELTVG